MISTNAEPVSESRADPDRHVVEGNRLELDLSDRAIAFIGDLLRDTGDSPEALIVNALGLYRLAVDAWREGKAVGSAPSAEALDAEFVKD